MLIDELVIKHEAKLLRGARPRTRTPRYWPPHIVVELLQAQNCRALQFATDLGAPLCVVPLTFQASVVGVRVMRGRWRSGFVQKGQALVPCPMDCSMSVRPRYDSSCSCCMQSYARHCCTASLQTAPTCTVFSLMQTGT